MHISPVLIPPRQAELSFLEESLSRSFRPTTRHEHGLGIDHSVCNSHSTGTGRFRL
jgi:hypothetical protein